MCLRLCVYTSYIDFGLSWFLGYGGIFLQKEESYFCPYMYTLYTCCCSCCCCVQGFLQQKQPKYKIRHVENVDMTLVDSSILTHSGKPAFLVICPAQLLAASMLMLVRAHLSTDDSVHVTEQHDVHMTRLRLLIIWNIFDLTLASRWGKGSLKQSASSSTATTH